MKILAIGDFHGKFPSKLKKAAKEVDVILSVGDFGGVKEWYVYLRYLFHQVAKNKPYKSAEDFFGKKRYKEIDKKDGEVTKGILKYLNSLGKPVIFTFGNTDDTWYSYNFDRRAWKLNKSRINFVKRLNNLKEITYSTTSLKGIKFSGFGGYMDVDSYVDDRARSKDSPELIQGRILRRARSKKKLFSLISGKAKKRILILHYPPKGYFDIIKMKGNIRNGTSAGIGFFLDAIKKSKPSLVLCGHMHEYQGMKKIGKSVLINPGPAGEGKAAIIDYDEGVAKVKKVKFLR
jgi:Icc-related predicted phosphoesterase